MKRAIHPIKADMMRLHRIFPAKFGLALMLAFGLLFGIFLKTEQRCSPLAMAFVGRILVSSGMQSILLRLMSPLRAALLPVHPCSFHSSFVWCFYRSMAIKRGTEFLRQEVSTAFMGL